MKGMPPPCESEPHRPPVTIIEGNVEGNAALDAAGAKRSLNCPPLQAPVGPRERRKAKVALLAR